jgi:hypothetical protein
MIPFILSIVGGYLIGSSTKEVFEEGGEMAKGGSLDSIKRKYEQNEDENAHSENVVLLAKHFGDVNDLKEAKEILAKHNKEGHLSRENGKKRQDLNLKLIAKARKEMNKEGIEFADGGMMDKGGENGGKYYVVDAKDGKIVSNGFDTEEEAKVEKFRIFEMTSNPFLTQKKIDGKVNKFFSAYFSDIIPRNCKSS